MNADDRHRRAEFPVRKRLAIVSTYDDLCGIAGYTRALKQRLARDFEVRVFDLDQFFMRSTHRRVRQLADAMIVDMCAQFQGFDSVNIQLEYGTLGARQDDIARRFRLLAAAAPKLSVTFHTILTRNSIPIWREVAWYTMTGRPRAAWNAWQAGRYERRVGGAILHELRRLQKKKWVAAIVHTRRDARIMNLVNRINDVFDHPLAFNDPAAARRIRQQASRADFPALSSLPDGVKLIGVFGFLNDYKGVETAIRALRHLPEGYHLAIFGGVHPNEIKRGPMNAYLSKLIAEIHADASVLDDAPAGGINLSLSIDDISKLYAHPKDVSARVHFMGAQTDDQFPAAMAVCDIVVLGYHEVGQSSSGPMSIAVEMGCRVVAARNHAFLQFARYHPDRVEFFDIGNHLELAERLRATPARESYPVGGYDVESNAAIYRLANAFDEVRAEDLAGSAPVLVATSPASVRSTRS